VITEWQAAAEQCPSDDFVDGIVSADIFPQDKEITAWTEKRRRVKSTGSAKYILCRAQFRRQLAKHFGIELHSSFGTAQPSTPKLRDGGLPANAAGRPRGKSSGGAVCRESHAGIESHAHEISLHGCVAWYPQRHQVLSPRDDAF
jgi:hypothetical protein